MKKETFCIVDIESKSRTPIDRGPANYFADPDAGLICLSYRIVSRTKAGFTAGKLKTVWLDGQDLPAALPAELKNFAGQFVAHNWFFEWSFFNEFYPGSRAADFRNWICTAAMARWFGICAPRAKLEEVAEAFGLEKMPEGRGLIGKYSIPQKDGSFNVCTDKEDAATFEKYCLKDAELSKAIYEKLDGKGFNIEEFRAAQAIDVRGVPIDVKAAKFLVERKEKDKKNAVKIAEEIAGRTPGGALVLSASGAFIDYMKKEFDIELPDARAATLDVIDFSEHPNSKQIENILYVRKLLTARAGDKASLILDRVHDGRVRNATVMHAAGTGRFQSWGVNFFNFSRQSVENWEKEKNTAPVPALQRGIICAPKGKTLIESDWRGIENYLSLYYAGDTEQLKRIEAGESPYLIFGEKLYGEKITKADKRYVPAKAGVLGCGYGAGAKKFSIIYHLPIEEATKVRDGWHRANQPIVNLWYDLHKALVSASVYRKEATVKVFTFTPLGEANDVKITLADGHVLYYRGLDVHYDEKNRVQIMRDGKALHGGLLLENLMQATCARLLYRALVACEAEGLQTVLHIYDSIMIESETKNAKRDAAKLRAIQCAPPWWAPDLKLAVDQHTGRRWTKS